MKTINTYIIEKLRINKDSKSKDNYTLNDFNEDDVCVLLSYVYKKNYCFLKVIKINNIILKSNYITYYYHDDVGQELRSSTRFEDDENGNWKYPLDKSKETYGLLLTPEDSANLLHSLENKSVCKVEWSRYLNDKEGKLIDLRKSFIDTEFIYKKDIKKYLEEFNNF